MEGFAKVKFREIVRIMSVWSLCEILIAICHRWQLCVYVWQGIFLEYCAGNLYMLHQNLMRNKRIKKFSIIGFLTNSTVLSWNHNKGHGFWLMEHEIANNILKMKLLLKWDSMRRRCRYILYRFSFGGINALALLCNDGKPSSNIRPKIRTLQCSYYY